MEHLKCRLNYSLLQTLVRLRGIFHSAFKKFNEQEKDFVYDKCNQKYGCAFNHQAGKGNEASKRAGYAHM